MTNTAQEQKSVECDPQAGARHVAHDIQMLVFAAGDLAGAWTNPVRPADGPRRKMAAECFVLHFRNLGLFLCDSNSEAGHIRAEDYGVSVHPIAVEFLLADHLSIEGMLGPAGCGRMRGILADRLSVAGMLAAAADALHDFMSRLQPEKAAWFLQEAETSNALALIDPLVQMLLAGPPEERDATRASYYN